jgi:hypothetical protein
MKYLFDKQWFADNQKILLFFLNAFILKRWVRWILRINKDCSFKDKIIEIQPNNYKIWLGENKIKADFRTHNKFSKRMYHAFYPLWCLFHIWDLFADKYVPQLSFGFATLTVYPDTGTGSTTVDGAVKRDGQNEVWASIKSGAGITALPSASTAAVGWKTAGGSPNFTDLYRIIATFDTSSLPDGASISSATISLYYHYKNDPASNSPTINVYSSTPASSNNLVAADYSQIGTTAYSTAITYANWTSGQYNDFALNATGLAAISKTGISKFGFREATYDAGGSTPTWGGGWQTTNIVGKLADQPGTSQDPKLVITYTPTTDYTLTCAQGSFTLTGIAVVFNIAISLIAEYGSFVLTGIAAGLAKGYGILAGFGTFVLTGFAATFKGIGSWEWKNQSKNSASATNTSKNSASTTNTSKNSASFTNQSKN